MMVYHYNVDLVMYMCCLALAHYIELCIEQKYQKLRSQFSGHTTKMLPHAALFIQFKIKVLLTIFFIVRIPMWTTICVNISQLSSWILIFLLEL